MSYFTERSGEILPMEMACGFFLYSPADCGPEAVELELDLILDLLPGDR
mgnify:CR=1 FL=1